MTTPDERLRDTSRSLEIIKHAAGIEKAAEDYLYMLCRITRVLDDIYDQDKPVSREQLLEVLEYLFIKLPTNSFYVSNQDVLISQHLSMWNAWMAANKWEHGDALEQAYAHVWRDTIHEVFPIVALLTQGHEQMKKVSEEIRHAFKKEYGD